MQTKVVQWSETGEKREIPHWLPFKATSLIGDHLAEVRQVGGANWLALNAVVIIRCEEPAVNNLSSVIVVQVSACA